MPQYPPKCGPPSGLIDQLTGGRKRTMRESFCHRDADLLLRGESPTRSGGWLLCEEHAVLTALWLDDHDPGITIFREAVQK